MGIQGGNITPPGQKFNSAIQAKEAEQIAAGYGEAQKAVQGLQIVANAQTLLKQIPPEQLGLLSDARLIANKIGESIGLGVLPETANIENLKMMFGENLLDRLRLFAPVSNSDARR